MIKLFTKTIAIASLYSLLSLSAFAGSGSFIGVEGESVSGTVTVSATSVQLSSDFDSSAGPDLYIYLGKGHPKKIIARLKKLSGAQTYALPKGINLSDYSAVFIHCKRFNHTFGKANLR